MRKNILVIGLLSFSVFLTNCEKEDRQELNIPASYDGSNYDANTQATSAIGAFFQAFVNEAKKGRNPGTKVESSTMLDLYNGGNPSLSSLTSNYYAQLISKEGGFISELSKASGNSYIPAPPNGNEGGVYNGYLFDENGLEMEQMIDKGLYGALLYHYAVMLTETSLNAATIDQIISLFGAHPEFPNTNNTAKTANPDKFLALYAARRDQNDGTGLYTKIKAAFIKLQAAVLAGENYKKEQEEALLDVFQNWEKANAATIINYCHQTISALSATNPTDQEKAAALHAYSEGVGFLHGWRNLMSPYKMITDSQIDEILDLMNAPHDDIPTSYQFVTDPVNQLPRLTQAIQKLKGIYSFSDQEIESFKKNWISEQGR